jgi:hypothetical protein
MLDDICVATGRQKEDKEGPYNGSEQKPISTQKISLSLIP